MPKQYNLAEDAMASAIWYLWEQDHEPFPANRIHEYISSQVTLLQADYETLQGWLLHFEQKRLITLRFVPGQTPWPYVVLNVNPSIQELFTEASN
jgi:hypothetical protein